MLRVQTLTSSPTKAQSRTLSMLGYQILTQSTWYLTIGYVKHDRVPNPNQTAWYLTNGYVKHAWVPNPNIVTLIFDKRVRHPPCGPNAHNHTNMLTPVTHRHLGYACSCPKMLTSSSQTLTRPPH